MPVIFILIIVSLVVAVSFLGLFIWANKSGQYDDTVSPAMRILFEDSKKQKEENKENKA